MPERTIEVTYTTTTDASYEVTNSGVEELVDDLTPEFPEAEKSIDVFESDE